jgi:predicted PurR-regulated permease PerM
VPREAELSPALTMIAVLSGVALFGFFGIVVGPVLFILAVTTIQVYADLVGEEPASG